MNEIESIFDFKTIEFSLFSFFLWFFNMFLSNRPVHAIQADTSGADSVGGAPGTHTPTP